MKSNYIVGITAVTVVTIAVCLAYSSKFWQKDLSFKESVNLILNEGKSAGREFLEKADVGYVKAWAKAAKAKKETFDFKGKTYLVNGGKSIKK